MNRAHFFRRDLQLLDDVAARKLRHRNDAVRALRGRRYHSRAFLHPRLRQAFRGAQESEVVNGRDARSVPGFRHHIEGAVEERMSPGAPLNRRSQGAQQLRRDATQLVAFDSRLAAGLMHALYMRAAHEVEVQLELPLGGRFGRQMTQQLQQVAIGACFVIAAEGHRGRVEQDPHRGSASAVR